MRAEKANNAAPRAPGFAVVRVAARALAPSRFPGFALLGLVFSALAALSFLCPRFRECNRAGLAQPGLAYPVAPFRGDNKQIGGNAWPIRLPKN